MLLVYDLDTNVNESDCLSIGGSYFDRAITGSFCCKEYLECIGSCMNSEEDKYESQRDKEDDSQIAALLDGATVSKSGMRKMFQHEALAEWHAAQAVRSADLTLQKGTEVRKKCRVSSIEWKHSEAITMQIASLDPIVKNQKYESQDKQLFEENGKLTFYIDDQAQRWVLGNQPLEMHCPDSSFRGNEHTLEIKVRDESRSILRQLILKITKYLKLNIRSPLVFSCTTIFH